MPDACRQVQPHQPVDQAGRGLRYGSRLGGQVDLECFDGRVRRKVVALDRIHERTSLDRGRAPDGVDPGIGKRRPGWHPEVDPQAVAGLPCPLQPDRPPGSP